MTDGPRIIGAADFQLSLGVDPLCRGLGELRLGLRDIGSGHLADPKAVLRRLELTAQDLLVAAVDFDQRLVPHDVKISLGNRLKNLSLDPECLGSRRLHRVDRLAGLRFGAAAAIERLCDPQIGRAGLETGELGR
jgi:hypothetical protein